MKYRFVHLSDIHFGQEKDGTLIRHTHIRDALTVDAGEFVGKRGPADRILITGDIAYAGKADDYRNAIAWLEKLTRACGCGEISVSTVPGNHDCDLDAIGYQAKMVYGQLRVSTPAMVQATLEGIAKEGEAVSPFLPKLQEYRQFASGYGCDFDSGARPAWIRSFPLPGGVTLRMLGLSSVQVSDLSDGEGKMVLGNQQYMIAEEQNVICVVLMHHPLNWFIDREEASQFLHNRARAILVGHEHNLRIEKTHDAIADREWLVLYAGAVNPPEPDGSYGFTYNWLEFSCREVDGKQLLRVEVFPRIWVQQRVRFEADTTRLGGQESVAIDILCPNVKPVFERGSSGTGGAPASSAIGLAAECLAASVGAQVEERPVQTQTDMKDLQMNVDSGALDRLRYLFWNYLGWEERLRVLIKVDALPKTASQPVPQTLERLALEQAQRSGRLHELWEAMMAFVPENKRERNPFPPEGSKR